MNPHDPRITPARPDLAARHLEGKVEAARFVDGALREVVAPQAPLRREPSPDAPLDTEALRGERVMVYETIEEGWSWGQLQNDSYVGWMPTEALREPGPPPTHAVAALRTLVFPGPSIKLPPLEALSLGCRLAVSGIEPPFAITEAHRYVPLRHLIGTEEAQDDAVSVAEQFTGAPYLWGGKTSFGLDCSALVQLAMTACGIICPRDSDMQENSLGRPITPADDFSNLRRGDLMFWKGHVAIVRDASTIVHANAHHMAVAAEPIADAVTRIRAAGCELSSVKRLDQ
ncbi:MAG: NlpC/P60 family protein [Xanthobacteraceae bacterium]